MSTAFNLTGPVRVTVRKFNHPDTGAARLRVTVNGSTRTVQYRNGSGSPFRTAILEAFHVNEAFITNVLDNGVRHVYEVAPR